MAVGLDADTESLQRGSIPSGGAGTLSDGGFTNCFAGVWVYRPSSTTTYALTAAGSFIHFQAGAREVVLGFNSAGAALGDLNLQIIFNSGGGTGTPATFSGHTGASFLDEWVYYFIADNPTDGQIAGYIRLADLATAVTQVRANDNAGSQYVNTLTFGNNSGNSAVAIGHYAFARAAYNTSGGYNTTDALAFAASTSPTGMWGFWPLADNTDTGDDSGNARTITFNGTLTSESDPPFAAPPVITVQPTDQTVNAGATATFTVTATGATSYQWKKNGSNVGTSSSSYALTAAYADQGAQITVDCINADGTTTSTAATLRVAFNLSGTGPRAFPNLGQPFGAGSVESWLRGSPAAGGDVTLSLTGVSATGQAGTLGRAISYTLNGNQATGQVGNAGDTVSYALTGIAATGQVGSLGDAVSYALTGVSASGAVGAVSYSNDITLALTGVAAAGAVGTLVPSVAYALTGNQATGSAGTLTSAAAYALSGVSATGNVGAVTANVSYALTGVQATGQVGTVGAGNDVTFALSGVQATGNVGAVAPSISYALTGSATAGQVGSVTANPSYALTGNAATGAVGSVGDAISYALTGVEAVGQVGTLSVPGDVTIELTGVQATGQVGSLSAAVETQGYSGQDGAGTPNYRKWRYTSGEQEEPSIQPAPVVVVPPVVLKPAPKTGPALPKAPAQILEQLRNMAEQRTAILAELDRQEREARAEAVRLAQVRAKAETQVRQAIQSAEIEQQIEDDDHEAIALALSLLTD